MLAHRLDLGQIPTSYASRSAKMSTALRCQSALAVVPMRRAFSNRSPRKRERDFPGRRAVRSSIRSSFSLRPVADTSFKRQWQPLSRLTRRWLMALR